MSDERRSYTTFDNIGSRLLLLLIVLLSFALIGFGIYSNYKLVTNIPPAVTSVGNTANFYAPAFSRVVDDLDAIGFKYNVTVPQVIYNAESILTDFNYNINLYTSGNRKADFDKFFSLASWLSSFPLFITFLSTFFLLGLLIFGRGCCASTTVIFAFFALFFIILFSVPYAASSFFTAGQCKNNLRTTIVDSIGQDVQLTCTAEVLSFYLFCAPLNDTCSPFYDLYPRLDDAISKLNQSLQQNPNQPDKKQDMETLIDISTVTHQDLDNCVNSKDTYQQAETTICWETANAATSLLLVSLLLFVMMLFTVFVAHLARHRVSGQGRAGNTAEMDSYNRYQSLPSQDAVYAINADFTHRAADSGTSCGMVFAFVIVLVVTCFAIGSVVIAGTLGNRSIQIN